ncbi:hypothetical protein [Prevotella sp. oral taxon 376]|uniref:hypothetical protein n=1 Tax=Prevotella sp. oral taxon 376 TaxID=712466 RepID=UPI0011B2863D|nr:hypothetical protein [Prevotella sp. oral taxon 376]
MRTGKLLLTLMATIYLTDLSAQEVKNEPLFGVFYYLSDSTRMEIPANTEYDDIMTGLMLHKAKIVFKENGASTTLQDPDFIYVEILDTPQLNHHYFRLAKLTPKKGKRNMTLWSGSPFGVTRKPKDAQDLWLSPVSGTLYRFETKGLPKGQYCIYCQQGISTLLKFHDFALQ